MSASFEILLDRQVISLVVERGMLWIEPLQSATIEPIIDSYTRKMAAAFRLATPGRGSRGCHRCICRAYSTSCAFELPNGQWTNSLCVHYLAFHREEVPTSELNAVAALAHGEAEPTAEELNGRA